MKHRLLLLLLLAAGLPLAAQNPIINDRYTADPSARVFGDTLWLYPSHDRDDAASFSMEDYHAYSSTDMREWRDWGVIFQPFRQTTWAKSAAWAPDCVERGGKYFLYYPTDKRHIGVAVSDTPHGPFRDPLGHPLISIDTPGVICDRDFIDPCVFIDDDGQAYLFCGQNTVCAVRLNPDMVSYDGEVHIIEGAKDFFEAVWVHKRGGIYYMSYSDGPFRGHEPRIAYATATSPLGPYTYQGVILGPVNSGTNHHSIVNYKGQDYLFYHTADISRRLNPYWHYGVRRSVCCDSLFYNADGTIRPVRPTLSESRARMAGISPERRMTLVAASVRQPTFPSRTLTLTPSKNALRSLQALIDTASAQGGATVRVPRGTWLLRGPLRLKSHVRLHLADGATLRFSGKPSDFLPPVFSRWEGTELWNRSAMIHADGQIDIAITGEGTATIDANGGRMARWGMPGGKPDFVENTHGTHCPTPEAAWQERLRAMGEALTPLSERQFGSKARLRPCAIELTRCNGVLLEGFTLTNSPFWCIHPLYTDDVTVRGVTINSHFPNNDGCDPESCRRVLIERCTFETGDDAIAIKSGRDADGRRVARPTENVVIRDCRFHSLCNGLCIGSELSGGVSGVYMKRIEIGDVKNALLFKSNRDRGGFISNVYVDSVTIGRVAGAVLRFETNYFGYRGGNLPTLYSDFRISHVRAQSAGAYALYFDGNASAPITGVRVSDFSVLTAPHAHYLYQTRDCLFSNCRINGLLLPSQPKEDTERRQCDVW